MDDLISRVKLICDDLAGPDGSGGQIALAKAAEASKSVVNQWLAGKIKSIDINYALAIEKNLGYNHIWLMIGKGPRKLGSLPAPETKIPGADEAHHALPLPRTDSPVHADVLMRIGFITDFEARILNLVRMATPKGRKLIEVAAAAAPRAGLASVLASDEPQNRLPGASDSQSR